MRPKPKPPTRAEIDDDLAASLKALGISDAKVSSANSADRVLAAYREAIAAEGRLVSAMEVGRRIGVSNSRISLVARNLCDAGRMLRAMDHSTGKVVYIPKAGVE